MQTTSHGVRNRVIVVIGLLLAIVMLLATLMLQGLFIIRSAQMGLAGEQADFMGNGVAWLAMGLAMLAIPILVVNILLFAVITPIAYSNCRRSNRPIPIKPILAWTLGITVIVALLALADLKTFLVIWLSPFIILTWGTGWLLLKWAEYQRKKWH